MVCSVYANLNDEDLSIEQIADITAMLIYIIEQRGVDIFEIDTSRKFERLCKNAIEFFGDLLANEVCIVEPCGITTYELFDDFYLYPIIPFGSYMICDENTKDIALRYTNVESIIKFECADTNIYFITGEVIHK